MSGVLALTGCSSSDDDDSGSSAAAAQDKADAAAAKQKSQAAITITPKDGADHVATSGDIKVQVKRGTLASVSLTAADSGKTVAGELSADKTSWEPVDELSEATKYQLTAIAKDSEGRDETRNTTFTTLSAANTVYGIFTPEDGSTVGVGMPVSINFTKPVANRAEVEKGITVTSSSGQEVVGHWFNDSRLDLRPQEYWKSGSQVTLKLRLKGVEASEGVYGAQSKDVSFTVGRSQVSTVDVATKQMKVMRDGKLLRTIPISAGSPENPTYNGEMVISQKFEETRMNGDTVGFEGEYDIPDVPHAMRLSTSGTFIHGNYWGRGVFGNTNTSHGCVGLEDVKGAGDPNTAGAWFYSQSMIGDVVKVVNSPDKTIAPDNGLNGWNMSWADWQAGSAL
ncbi:hypothetical protein AQ490_09325 [Wenjunlia vitaminophila]|uniref:L,D-TPase catalytic domain-containing protein n=2 Tax=Wenjunlia vitaminophila TaxID=76728 RepID=A0A0T6LM34_WENVI|nr:Ig-like domain-containing protein [Wenjunlia vitaminophila]KRV47191.1 hypothetical protein AQ490_09325 [Wenjunlia vitaminophila]